MMTLEHHPIYWRCEFHGNDWVKVKKTGALKFNRKQAARDIAAHLLENGCFSFHKNRRIDRNTIEMQAVLYVMRPDRKEKLE